MNIYITDNESMENNIELLIIDNLNKNFPYFYYKIKKTEIINIINILNIKINSNIIKSIKSLYTINYIINNNYKIKKYTDNIIKDYKNKINILDLCKKYKLSPLSLLRIVIYNIYSFKLSNKNISLINNNFDKKQLKIAIKKDYYSSLDESKSQQYAELFENKIEKILKKMKIEYKTQKELVEEQIKIYNRPINTPDFLIISDFYINDIKINWIDAKNFYGANINFFIKKLEKQQRRYINMYGSGCIIFSLGFNEILLKNQDCNNNMIIYTSYKLFKKNKLILN